MPGPPFAFGSVLVLLALLVAIMIPSNPHAKMSPPNAKRNPPTSIEKFQRDTGTSNDFRLREILAFFVFFPAPYRLVGQCGVFSLTVWQVEIYDKNRDVRPPILQFFVFSAYRQPIELN